MTDRLSVSDTPLMYASEDTSFRSTIAAMGIQGDFSSLGEFDDNTDTTVLYDTIEDVPLHDYQPWLQLLAKERGIARINGSLCIYIKDANGWMPVRSAVGLDYIARLAGKYAPVNYAIAVEPIVQIIERGAWTEITPGPTFTKAVYDTNLKWTPKLTVYGFDVWAMVPARSVDHRIAVSPFKALVRSLRPPWIIRSTTIDQTVH